MIEQISRSNKLRLSSECKIISSSIYISRSKFSGDVIFSNCLLDSDAWFQDVAFIGLAFFKGATFTKNASFEKVTFGRGTVFIGATFDWNAQFEEATFKYDAWFRGAIFSGEAKFKDTAFSRVAQFVDVTFKEDAWFQKANFNGKVSFLEATFGENTSFQGATFGRSSSFMGATFFEDARFKDTTFSMDVRFRNVIFNGDAWFNGAAFSGDSDFSGVKFEGDVLTFRNATFDYAKSQEEACRRAKNVLEKNGNREEAGYHFYREMEGKRKQKPRLIRYPEWLFIQLIFGYGVHPPRLMACWLGFVGLFAAAYMLWHGIDPIASQLKGNATLADYVWFSIATAVTPGYAGYKPTPDFKWVAGLEAIFGTFMWAAFITTFAKKYMR